MTRSISSWIPVVKWFYILPLILFVCHGYSQTEPPERVRLEIEEDTVAIRLFDPTNSIEIGVGTGYIVGDDGDVLTVLTANHVISKSRVDSDLEILVRFYGRDVWVDAYLDSPVYESDDVATLSIRRTSSRFGNTPRGRSLSINPPPENDGALWVYGYDKDLEEMVWASGVFISATNSSMDYNARQVREGYSGAVVVSKLGPVAMAIKRGGGGRGHQSLRIDHISGLLHEKNIAFDLQENPAAIALAHVANTGLTMAMHVFDLDDGSAFWTGIRIQSKLDDDGYDADLITGEMVGKAHISANKNGITVTILDQDLRWNIRGNFPKLTDRELHFWPTAEVVKDDFVILKAETTRGKVYIAIPTGNTEYLMSRVFVENTNKNSEKPNLDSWVKEVARISEASRLKVDSTDQPFTLLLNNHFGKIIISAPRSIHQDEHFVISCGLRLSDEFRSIDNITDKLPRYRNIRMETTQSDGNGVKAYLQLDGNIAMCRNQPLVGISTLMFPLESRTFSGQDYLLLTDLLISYDSLKDH